MGAINYPSATENFLKKNGNIFENENGEKYQVTVTYDGVIRPNSVVSFGATAKNKYGHVAVVEAVQDEGGTQYVYFTEGNNSKIADGTLQKMELSKFLNYSGGYTGSVNYEKIS